ncbi:ribonuclease PH [Candidatus Dependentiae bacterium]|nr:ribonuclease PH [Candidatus Dependentiae bacterium]
MNNKRYDGRTFNQIRSIKIKHDHFGYSDGSVLFEMGITKVLISVTIQNGVPQFLRGKKVGWLTAEYAMLPCATKKRTIRESSQYQRNSRSVEISRLIGRCLRSVVALELLGERTILVDCDVLQADGGTRVACITAACIALNIAISRWMKVNILEQNILKENIAAISVGMVKENILLDLTSFEDNQADVDFNFVMTESQKIIEIQGTAETQPLSWQDFEKIKKLSIHGINKIFDVCFKQKNDLSKLKFDSGKKKSTKKSFFSLANRLEKSL